MPYFSYLSSLPCFSLCSLWKWFLLPFFLNSFFVSLLFLDIMTKRPTYLIVPYALVFFYFHLYLASRFVLCVCNSYFLFFSTHFFLSFLFFFKLINLTESPLLITFSFIFPVIIFKSTFRVTTHNSHPQLMAFPRVEVHITQCWVRDKTRSVCKLASLNLGFLPKLRCTCSRRNQGQHIKLREGELVKKIKTYYRLNIFW